MATRTCSSCNKDLQKGEYSKNQWSKGAASKCKGCVSGVPPPSEPKKEETVVEPQPEVVDNKADEDAAKKAAEEKAAAE